MRETQVFVIKCSDEETARKRAMEWYAHKQNLTINSVEAYSGGGFSVSISYDEPYSAEDT